MKEQITINREWFERLEELRVSIEESNTFDVYKERINHLLGYLESVNTILKNNK